MISQRNEVVDLAIEHDRVAAIGAAHRLPAVLDVDDREAAYADPDIRRDKYAFIIRSAIHHRIAHPPDPALQLRGVQVATGNYAGNSTHID